MQRVAEAVLSAAWVLALVLAACCPSGAWAWRPALRGVDAAAAGETQAGPDPSSPRARQPLLQEDPRPEGDGDCVVS